MYERNLLGTKCDDEAVWLYVQRVFWSLLFGSSWGERIVTIAIKTSTSEVC